jgi:hypothetical protein
MPETFPAFQGVILTLSADQTAVNLTTATFLIPWNNEVVDTDGFHDNVTNPSRITIPSAVNGKYGIFGCNIWITSLTASSFSSVQLNKNGSLAIVSAISGSFNGGDTQAGNNIFSLPFLLTTGDYYEALPFVLSDTSVTIESDQSSFSLMVLP